MKSSKKLMILAPILLLSIAAYVGFSLYEESGKRGVDTPQRSPSEESFISDSLFSVDEENIQRIVIKHGGGEEFSLIPSASRQNNRSVVWRVDGNEEVKFDTTMVNHIPGVLLSLRSVEEFVPKDKETFEHFGLEPPNMTLEVLTRNADIFTLSVGNAIASPESFYLRVGDEDSVHIIPAFLVAPLLSSLDSLRDRSLPFPNAEAGLSLLYMKNGSEVIEIRESVEGESPLPFSSLRMVRPYSFQRGVDPYELDETLKRIPNPLQKKNFIDDNPATLSQYGLGNSVKTLRVRDRSGGDLFLHIGGEDASGDRYASLDGEEGVFTVDGSIIHVFDSTPFSLVDKFILMVNIQKVSGTEFRFEDTVWSSELTYDDNDVLEYSFDGSAVSEEEYKDYYQQLLSLFYDGEAVSVALEGEPQARILYKLRDGGETFADFYPYPPDGDYYLVSVDGESPFFVASRRQIEYLASVSEDFAVE